MLSRFMRAHLLRRKAAAKTIIAIKIILALSLVIPLGSRLGAQAEAELRASFFDHQVWRGNNDNAAAATWRHDCRRQVAAAIFPRLSLTTLLVFRQMRCCSTNRL